MFSRSKGNLPRGFNLVIIKDIDLTILSLLSLYSLFKYPSLGEPLLLGPFV
jgi:hypothetical protein